MLEQMRRNSKSVVIWILFGIIITVFIISFGPQSNQASSGCGGTTGQHALTVEGAEVSLHSWRFAMNGLRYDGGGGGAQRRARALDYLLERELLAQAAEQRGFRVSDDVVNNAIAAGDLYIMGHRLDGSQAYYKEGAFDYDSLERFTSQVGLPNVGQLVSEQRREQLAEMMRETILGAAHVSEEEARQSYIQENTKVKLDVALFEVARYEEKLELSDADLLAWAGRHGKEIEARWDAEKAMLTTAKPRVNIRHILVKKPSAADAEGATDEGEAAATEGDAAKKAASAAKVEATDLKDRLAKARARIVAGADFGAVARELSEEAESRGRGGRVGWRPAESLGYGKEVVAATSALAVGGVSDVIEAADGFHLIKVEARSDKALTLDDVKIDMAAELAPEHLGRLLAKRDAEAALARARTTPLDKVFEREAAPAPALPEITPEMLGLPPNEPPADTEAPATPTPASGEGKQGWVIHEGELHFAQSGGAAPAASAAPGVPAAAAPGSAAAAAPAADAPVDEGPLPKVTVDPPKLKSVGPTARRGDFVPGLGRAGAVIADAFERLEVGKVADKVYEIETPEGFAVVQLSERSEADLAKFDAEKGQLEANLTQRRSAEILVDWVTGRCNGVVKDGEVSANPSVVNDGEQGPPYQPCRNINFMSVYQQLQSRQR